MVVAPAGDFGAYQMARCSHPRSGHSGKGGRAPVRALRRRAAKIVRLLKKQYPDATCALEFRTPLELLVATMLSAQCTDERVNQVTQELFQQYRTAEDYAMANPEELEQAIRSTGFYRNKAQHIQGAARRMIERFGGEVPRTMEELLELPGVARKTANVVLGVAFHRAEGIVVDTHVQRVARRLGLTRQQDPGKIERELMATIPRDWPSTDLAWAQGLPRPQTGLPQLPSA